jgi:hypothetical protein
MRRIMQNCGFILPRMLKKNTYIKSVATLTRNTQYDSFCYDWKNCLEFLRVMCLSKTTVSDIKLSHQNYVQAPP